MTSGEHVSGLARKIRTEQEEFFRYQLARLPERRYCPECFALLNANEGHWSWCRYPKEWVITVCYANGEKMTVKVPGQRDMGRLSSVRMLNQGMHIVSIEPDPKYAPESWQEYQRLFIRRP